MALTYARTYKPLPLLRGGFPAEVFGSRKPDEAISSTQFAQFGAYRFDEIASRALRSCFSEGGSLEDSLLAMTAGGLAAPLRLCHSGLSRTKESSSETGQSILSYYPCKLLQKVTVFLGGGLGETSFPKKRVPPVFPKFSL